MLSSQQIVSYGDIASVPLPAATRSYQPVGHASLIDLIKTRTTELLPKHEIASERFGLARDGQQMFSVLTLKTDDAQRGLSIGARNSYDKSLSVGIASGLRVFVCDNLCFSGDSMKVVRKHTTNVWGSLTDLVDAAILGATAEWTSINDELKSLESSDLSIDEGYQLIGLALGRRVLATNQATVAFKDWRTPRHEEFVPRNAWSLYNCFTEGLKKTPAGSMLDRHHATHAFFRDVFDIQDVAPVVDVETIA